MKEAYEDVLERCKEQGIDTTDCHLYIYPDNLDGNSCLKGTIHGDEWVCIPVKEYDESFDEPYFNPVCFKIKSSFQTYLKGDSMWHLVNCYLLYKNSY